MRKSVYTEIADRLQVQIEGVWVDLYNEQFAMRADVYRRPAVFIEFSEILWEQQGKNTQQGVGTIVFHVVQEAYSDTHEGSPQQSKALEVLDFLEQVHVALQGVSGSEFGALNRIRSAPAIDFDNLVIHQVEYETVITDMSSEPEFTDVQADVYVEPEINRPVPDISPYTIP